MPPAGHRAAYPWRSDRSIIATTPLRVQLAVCMHSHGLDVTNEALGVTLIHAYMRKYAVLRMLL